MVDQPDRRRMIKTMEAGLVALRLPQLAHAAADKPFGYAIVGLGPYATRQIMPAFAQCDHARLVALVRGTPAKLDWFGAEYDIPATHRYSYAQFDRIRDNPDIKAVYGRGVDDGHRHLQRQSGLPGEETVDVSAVEATDRPDPRFRTEEDRISFLLRFPSGIEATCVSSYGSVHNRYRDVGTEGWIDLEPATSYAGRSMRIMKAEVVTTRTAEAGNKSQFAGQLDHLAECVRAGTTPIVAGEEGLKDLRIIEAIYRSVAERRQVSLLA